MFCTSCGAEIMISAKFCGKCGLKLSEKNINSSNSYAIRKQSSLEGVYESKFHFYFESALLKQNSKDYQGSILDWEKAIEIDPHKDPTAYYNLALCLSELGDRKSAIDNYTKAIKMNPAYAEAFTNRGVEWWIYLNETKHLGEDYFNLRVAIQDWLKGQILGDKTAIKNLKMVKNEIQKQTDIDKEKDHHNESYEKSLLSNVSNVLSEEKAFFYHDLGVQKMLSGDYKRAISNFNKTISICPYAPCIKETYLNLAAVKGRSSDFSGAISSASKAIEIDPRYAEAYLNRGINKSMLGENNEAMSDFNKAIEINPKDSNLFLCRGRCKADLSNLTGAVEDFEKALEINPKDTAAFEDRESVIKSINRKKKLDALKPLFFMINKLYFVLSVPLGIFLFAFARIALKTLLKQLFSS